MLRETLSAIEAEFEALTTADLAPEVAFAFGKRELSRNARAPRVVWVVERDPITAAGYAPAIVDGEFDDTSEADPIRTREAGVKAHVWGVSFAQTEAIAVNLVAAGFKYLQGNDPFTEISWLEHGEADWVTSGWGAVVPLTVRIPIMREMVTIPTEPDAAATNPDGATKVKLVAGDPGENEANIKVGTAAIDQDPTD